MYADWTNQLFQIIRYGSAFIILMIFWPRLLFWRVGGDLLERWSARFILMTLLLIILGYILVAAKVFEVLAIFPILVILAVRALYQEMVVAKKLKDPKAAVKLYDWLEDKYNPWPDIKLSIKKQYQNMIYEIRKRLIRVDSLIETLLLLFVFSVSGYIRFYDAFVHAAPAMSDGYVTLAWIKYIDQRLLFYDGIYPQGFHIWMDYLAKFSMIDTLYILKYTGPLNALLLMLGMYLAVSRWTGSRSAGILTAAIYGLLGSLISSGAYERQASTNSQEFAFVFIIPVLFFLHHWLQNRVRWALISGIAGMMLVGLIHTLPYIFLGLGVFIMLLIYLPLTIQERFRSIWPVIWGGLASIVISIIPLGIGLLFGKEFHSSSEEFAISRNVVKTLPDLEWVDWITLAAIIIMLLWVIWHIRRVREYTAYLFLILFTCLTFAIYYFGNLMTFPGSTVITSRSTELWSIVIPVSIGTAIGISFCLIQDAFRNRYFQSIIAAVLIAICLIMVPPKPIIPYKMEWNSGVEQYLKISDNFLPKSFHIVSHSEEGHGLVLGKGFPMDTSIFLTVYDPGEFPLTKYGEIKPDSDLSKDVFIYYQKKIHRLDESFSFYATLEPIYVRREEEMKRLEEWVKQHEEVNPNLSIWYEDEVLRIYHIHQPTTKEEKFQEIWGKGVVAP